MKTGEIKMNAKQDIIVSSTREETLSWKRYIHFKYQDKEYSVLLFWDEFNGYEIYWKDKESELLNSHIAPEWAVNWDEDLYEGMSLAGWLDELTFQGTTKNPDEDLFNELISSAEKLIQMTGEKKND
jgi:hypothetical protein